MEHVMDAGALQASVLRDFPQVPAAFSVETARAGVVTVRRRVDEADLRSGRWRWR